MLAHPEILCVPPVKLCPPSANTLFLNARQLCEGLCHLARDPVVSGPGDQNITHHVPSPYFDAVLVGHG